MFIGTEDLWRLRREVGDTYHAQFWGQAIQFLTLSRLLGENKRITLETDRGAYAAGDQVQVFANVLSDGYEPVRLPAYAVRIESRSSRRDPVELELTPAPDIPGLYVGALVAEEAGTFVVRTRADDQAAANAAEFTVLTTPLEQRETAMQAQVANQLADLSGGKALALRELSSLPDRIVKKNQVKVIRTERSLWDLPLVFVLLVLRFTFFR
jgi:hypothetical protein